MEVGKSCPQYQEYGTLFTESKGLQKQLCLYFTAVIDLCREIILFSRKSLAAQLPKLLLPFDVTFSSIKANLRELATAIRDEIALASSRQEKQERGLNAEERKENASFRALATRLKDQVLTEVRLTNRHWALHRRSAILASLSQYNQTTTWKQARSKGCTKWILDKGLYKRWKNGSGSRIFCLVGKLGSGKTVAMANVIADLASGGEFHLSYFFCRFDDIESLKARTVIGCLLKQMLTGIDFDAPEDVSSMMDIDELVELCLSLLVKKPERNHVICLDGLDECEDREKKQIMSALRRLWALLSGKVRLSFFCSVRPDGVHIIEELPGPSSTLAMAGFDNDNEICEYIRASVEEQLESKNLVLGDATLVTRIVQELRTKADGMYLWVFFQLQSICEQTTDHDIIQTLDSLPSDMHETYTRILSRIKNHKNLAQKVFEIVAVAERPLELEELREVLAVEPGELTLNASDLVNDISKTLRQSGGSLLTVDEEDSRVSFVHESVRQFFTKEIGEDSNHSEYRIELEKADLDLGLRCITYLNMGVFNTQLTKVKDPTSWNQVTPDRIINDTLAKDSSTTKLALKILRAGKGVKYDIGEQLERTAALRHRPTELAFAFLLYAKAYVLAHTKKLFECDSNLDSLFRRIFSGSLPFLSLPWYDGTVEPWAPGSDKTLGTRAISWAVDNNHLGLIYRAMRANAATGPLYKFSGNFKLSASREAICELLELGFARQRKEVLCFLFRIAHIQPDVLIEFIVPVITYGDTLLDIWMKQGDPFPSIRTRTIADSEFKKYGIEPESLAMCLKNNQIQKVRADTAQWDIIALAAAYNSFQMIELGAFGDMSNKNLSQFLLHGMREAACRGHIAIFKDLLDLYFSSLFRKDQAKALPTEYDTFGWTPLHYAAALPDADVYNNLWKRYKNENFHEGTRPALIFSLAHGDQQSVAKLIGTDKEAVGSAQIIGENGTVIEPVVEVQNARTWEYTNLLGARNKDPRRGVNWSPSTGPSKRNLLEKSRSKQQPRLMSTGDNPRSFNPDSFVDSDAHTLSKSKIDNLWTTSEARSPIASDVQAFLNPPAFDDYRLTSVTQEKVRKLHPSPLDSLDSASKPRRALVKTALADFYATESAASNVATCSGLGDTPQKGDRTAVEDFFARQVETDKAPAKFVPGMTADSDDWWIPADKKGVPSNLLSYPRDVSVANPRITNPFLAIDARATSGSSVSGETLWEDDREKRKGVFFDSYLRQILSTSRANPGIGKVDFISRRWPAKARSKTSTLKSRNKHDIGLQVLRAQNIALEAQTALIQASQSGTKEKLWWENPFLVFVMFILWPSMCLFGAVYMMQPFGVRSV